MDVGETQSTGVKNGTENSEDISEGEDSGKITGPFLSKVFFRVLMESSLMGYSQNNGESNSKECLF